MKHTLISVLLIALAGGMAAQTVNISGQYVDKLENPIADAFVRFYRGGEVPTDSTYTDASGNFLLSFSLTGMDAPPQKPFLENPRPNPFTGHSSFVIQTDGPAILFVHTVNGLHVDKLSLPHGGTYACSWGGRNRIGQAMPAGTYVITVAGTGFNTSRKVVFEGRATRRLSAEKTGDQAALKSLLTQDLIRFTKQNTSEHELWINQVFSDTTLGAITGNVGPELLSTLVVNVHIDSLELWNLNEHFYNDDQSIYTVDDTQNFAIINDTMLSFIGSQQGFYQPEVTATDPADPQLQASMNAEVTIYTDYNVTVNGSYMDKTGQPIAQASVKYFEGGTTILGQTITNNFGEWSLTVSLSRNSFDELHFSKTNTSLLVLSFPPPLADTSFGVVTGNIGPTLLSAIVANVHLDSLEMWNLNEHFHNDDQSIYTVDDTQNFAIVNDSLLSFIGSQGGFYEPEITANDPQDPLLTALMEAEVAVRSERHVSLSGEYRDKINDPIAGAQLSYWEGGSTLLGQTTTGSQGEWLLTVTLGLDRTNDELHFEKEHTTPLVLAFDPPLADTSFGVVTGNIGPTLLSAIVANVHLDSLEMWNLNDHFHNDDQSIYTVDDTQNFAVVNDSLLSFIGSQSGLYEPEITATDPQDPLFTALMEAEVTVRSERHVNLSGEYRDKINDPIAGAQVSYWEGGSTMMEQTTTGSQGEWLLTVTLGLDRTNDELPTESSRPVGESHGFNRTTDELHFQKSNTSPLILSFPSPLADTSFGTVTGNIGPTATGSIAETRFSIEGTLEWDLNNYFHNDDQSSYTITGTDFTLANQHWLQLASPALGSYNTAITATDPQDATLTAQTTAAVDVEYTIDLPESFSIPEDAPAGTLVADFSQYVNPACTYDFAYTLLSNSNPELITFEIQGAQLLADSLQPDGHGQAALSVLMENLSGSGADTLWFDVNVLSMTDVYGTVTDILDSTLIAGATVYIFIADDNPNIMDTVAVLTTDANGNFHHQFEENPDTLTYFFVKIEKYAAAREEGGYAPYLSWLGVNTKRDKTHDPDALTSSGFDPPRRDKQLSHREVADVEYSVALIPDELAEAYRPRKATAPRNSGDYTPRHTWLTVNPGGMDVEMNYTIFLQSQIYELYNRTMRVGSGLTGSGFPMQYADTTRHWVSPPGIHLYNDSTHVGGQDLTIQFANLVYNVQNILPTFNPDYALPENVFIHQNFSDHFMQDNEMGAFFDNSIPGSGVVTVIYDGPRINKCLTQFLGNIGLNGPDISTFNQELGSCFGAVIEPPQSPNYTSVFTDPAGSNTYTDDDFDLSKLYLDRAKIHYRNQTYAQSNPDGWDWEARPDIIEDWYSSNRKSVNTHMERIIFDFDGEVKERGFYAYDRIPSEIMEGLRFEYTKEDVAVQRIREENGLNTQPLYLWRRGEGVVVDCGCE